jgi:hypothetical protein
MTRGRVCKLQCNDASSISSYIVTFGLSASSFWCRDPSQSKIHITTDNQSASPSWCLVSGTRSCSSFKTDSQSASLSGVRRPSGPCDQFFFLLEISFRQLGVCDFVAPSLTRGRVCKLLYSCFWALPEQPLLGRSPAELTAIFNCLI